MTHSLRRYLPYFLFLLLPCLLLWPVLANGEAFLPADLLRDISPWRTTDPKSLLPWNPLMWDGIAEFYPWRVFASNTLHSGYLPLWNPYQFCGTPFVANSQSAVFYPLNLLFYILPVWKAFGVSVLLHLFLTGSFAYWFLRSPQMGLGRAAALLGAVAWQLCHWQVAWLELPTFLCVSAWLPLALLWVDRTVERPTPFRAGVLGLCLGIMLLAGHLQIALYCLGLITAYALFRALPRLRSDGPRLLGCALLVLALAFGLAAPQILPTLELARVSHRAGGLATVSAYHGYIRLALPPANLITLWLPSFFGSPTRGTYWGIGLNGGPSAYIENACYCGILTLLLSFAGTIATWRSDKTTRFFAVTALVSLLLALGTPLNALPFFGIPGFAQTGSPGRILVLWSFCTAVLAAQGAQAVLRSEWRILLKPLAYFCLFGLLALGYAFVWFNRYTPSGYFGSNLSEESDLWRLPLGLLLAGCAAIWLRQRGSLKTSPLGATLALLVGVDLLAAGYGFNRTTDPKNIYPVTPLIAYLQAHRDEGRIMPINRHWSGTAVPPYAVLPPNAATVYGLYDTQGYDSLLTGQYFQFAGRLDNGSPAPQENGNLVFTYGIGSMEAREAGARYVVTREPLGSETPAFEDNGTYVYEDKKASARVRNTKEKNVEIVASPTRIMLLSEDLLPKQFVVADQWYPGWHAYFRSEPVTMTPEPDIFRTLTFTTRQQNVSWMNNPVEMRYEPEAFRVGLYAMCLALGGAAALGAAAMTERLNRRRRRL